MKVVWESVPVDAISMITDSLSGNVFPQQNSSKAGIHISRDTLLEIVFMTCGRMYPPSLNAFRKLVLEVHDSEVAPVIMRVDEELHVADVHNITD